MCGKRVHHFRLGNVVCYCRGKRPSWPPAILCAADCFASRMPFAMASDILSVQSSPTAISFVEAISAVCGC